MKRAVLLLNLGGPETLADVKPFLFRLFSDPEIIRIPIAPLRLAVAWLISTLRYKKSRHLYEELGGGSPIRKLTDEQAAALENRLCAEGYQVIVRTAFSCSGPLIKDVVRDLAAQGVTDFLALPLYPQYSFTTTKSALDQTRAAVKRYASSAVFHEIHSYPTHPLFIKAHIDRIKEAYQGDDVYLLFSAHSIPEKLVTKNGDPYRDQMEGTVYRIVDALKWKGAWSLAWQSRLGPVKWLEPSTVDVIRDLGKKGIKKILIVPVAFVTDHIETLHEIDREMKEDAARVGIKEFYRAKGLNAHPLFIEALAELAKSEKSFWLQV